MLPTSYDLTSNPSTSIFTTVGGRQALSSASRVVVGTSILGAPSLDSSPPMLVDDEAQAQPAACANSDRRQTPREHAVGEGTNKRCERAAPVETPRYERRHGG